LTDPISHLNALAELVRIHRGNYGKRDVAAFAWLEQHDPPLVYIGPLSVPLVTDEGARVVGELVATWVEQT
jgi:hypothetical protein